MMNTDELMKLADAYAIDLVDASTDKNQTIDKTIASRASLKSALEAMQAQIFELQRAQCTHAQTALEISKERDALQAKLTELQKQEPVAWMDDFGNAFPLAANKGAGSWMDAHKRTWKKLYASPKALEQLSNAALIALNCVKVDIVDYDTFELNVASVIDFARAIEAAHGIGGQTTQPATDSPAIHCKAKRENNGVCPHHNLQCGWPKCNEIGGQPT